MESQAGYLKHLVRLLQSVIEFCPDWKAEPGDLSSVSSLKWDNHGSKESLKKTRS